MDETQNNCQSSSNWGFMQDLTSWSFKWSLSSMIMKSCGTRMVPLLKKAHVQARLKFAMIQRRPGWKYCGQMRPKSSSFASTQLTVSGGGGMLPMTPRTPSPLSNMEVETLWFGGVFLLRGQDNCTASKGRCTVRARALKPARASKMGHGWIFHYDYDTEHTAKAT